MYRCSPCTVNRLDVINVPGQLLRMSNLGNPMVEPYQIERSHSRGLLPLAYSTYTRIVNDTKLVKISYILLK